MPRTNVRREAETALADAAMASLGSALKKREMLSARLGDVLSNLYLASMVLKQWQAGDNVEHEAALLHYSCRTLLFRAEQALVELLDNLPNRALAKSLKFIVMPLGRRWEKPQDSLTRDVAKVSVIGVGMKSHAGVAATMFKSLADRGINIQAITTSEIKVSVMIDEDETELAVRVLHTAYGLDAVDEAA